jgi:hypothetical protein
MRIKLVAVAATVGALGAAVAVALAAANGNFSTHLKGQFEVPMRDTNAQGQALFKLSDDGQSMAYKVIASNIENAFMSHIHLGPPTQNGPIVVWLYPSTAPVPGPFGSGRHDGVLAEGTFTSADFVGPLAGHSMSELVQALETGAAYVNVHTNDGVDGVNTGPGDFPGGEVRGQVEG